jgi:hypothetical protein
MLKGKGKRYQEFPFLFSLSSFALPRFGGRPSLTSLIDVNEGLGKGCRLADSIKPSTCSWESPGEREATWGGITG